MRGQIRNSGRAFWGLLAAAWKVRTGSLLCPWGGMSAFLMWGQGGGLTGAWAGGVAQVVCPPLWWSCVQGACAIPCFCSGLFKSGSWVLGSLFVTCPEFAPYSFFVFCCCNCKHCSTLAKGLPFQPVSADLRCWDLIPSFLLPLQIVPSLRRV